MLKVLPKDVTAIPSVPLDPAIQTYWKDLFNTPYTGLDMTKMQMEFHRFANRVATRVGGVCNDISFVTTECDRMSHCAHFSDEYVAKISSYDRFRVKVDLEKSSVEIVPPLDNPGIEEGKDPEEPEVPEAPPEEVTQLNDVIIGDDEIIDGGDTDLDEPSIDDDPVEEIPEPEDPEKPGIIEGGDVELDPDPDPEKPSTDYEITIDMHISLTALSDDNTTQSNVCRATKFTYKISDEGSTDIVGMAIMSIVILLFNFLFDAEFEEITKDVYDELNKKDDSIYSSSCGSCDDPCKHGGDGCGKCTAEVLSSKNEIYLCSNCHLHNAGIRYFNTSTTKLYCPSCTCTLLAQKYSKSECLKGVCLCSGLVSQIALIDQIIQENDLGTTWIKLA